MTLIAMGRAGREAKGDKGKVMPSLTRKGR